MNFIFSQGSSKVIVNIKTHIQIKKTIGGERVIGNKGDTRMIWRWENHPKDQKQKI